jgi:ribosome recycling factor
MHAILVQNKARYQGAVDQLTKELTQLRTGRATPALVEDILVSAYGSNMEVKGLASVQIPDAKTLIIDPWDKGLIQNIEKGIRDAGIGLSPVVDGTVIRIIMPLMTEDNRKQMVKRMKEMLEDAKIRIRGVREDIRSEVLAQEKAKDISEDEKFKLFDEIDGMTKEFNDDVVSIGSTKEDEIMTV